MKKLVDKNFMKSIKFDKLFSATLRSDIKNNNIYGCYLKTQGYVGNRPSDCNDEFHEDDTWAIDVITSDELVVDSYLYSSEYEYNEDVKLIKHI